MNLKPFLLTLLCVSNFASAQQGVYKTNKLLECNNAAVVSAHPLASKVGVNILKKGGNAVDAAIATQLALAVVYPAAGNLGGGGFMVASFNTGKRITLDYREKAPAAGHKDMYLDANGNPVTKLSEEGHLAAGVPGTVAGLFASLKYARLDFKQLIEPAIQLAEKGFAITTAQASSFNYYKSSFNRVNKKHFPFVKREEWKTGDILVQPELASTLKRIRDKGQNGFYEGETARMIVDEMKGKGLISYEDLKNYRAVEREPMVFNYKGNEILTMSLSSSGGILLQQMFKMIRDRNIKALGHQTSASVQLMIEVQRRAYADRAFYLGDPDYVKVPVKHLVTEAYLQQRMHDFVPGKAGSSITIKEGMIKESEETTHISVIDRFGNAVSVTTTLNDSYGGKLMVTGAGFLLNNEMDDFSVKEGHPNMYGALGNAANAIAPGKRMLSSMSPTIVLKNKKPVIIIGTPGGTTIPTNVFQALVNLLEFNLSPLDAVNTPKFHHQWMPDSVYFEKDYPADVIQKMSDMGYKTITRTPIGRMELITINYGKRRKITAVADKRGEDSAEGY